MGNIVGLCALARVGCDLDSGMRKIFSNLQLDHINALLDTVPHRKMDQGVLSCLRLLTEMDSLSTNILSHPMSENIMLPPTTHSIAHHLLVIKGISYDQSTKVPLFVHASLNHGQAVSGFALHKIISSEPKSYQPSQAYIIWPIL